MNDTERAALEARMMAARMAARKAAAVEFFGRVASIGAWIGLVAIVVFFAEHVGRKTNIRWLRVSVLLGWTYLKLRPVAEWAGRVYATLVTFFSLINLEDLNETARDILVPTWKLTCLPVVAAREAYRHVIGYHGSLMIGTAWLIWLLVFHVWAPSPVVYAADLVTLIMMWARARTTLPHVEPEPELEPEQPRRRARRR